MASRRSLRALLALTASLGLVLAGCSSTPEAKESHSAMKSQEAEKKGPKTIVDFSGNKVKIPESPKSVVVTDNRSFQILKEWKVDLKAAPLPIMSPQLHGDYVKNPKIIDLGSHREPNLEAFVSAAPDLVINGQRFAKQSENVKSVLPKDTAFVDINLPEDMPLEEYFPKQVMMLGDIFNKQAEAKKMVADFNKAIERAKKAYDKKHTVMGLITSGGAINYAAPGKGRAVGPLFPMLGLTPALEQQGSTDHQGDEVSVEAIAATNPEWIVVLDRDQAMASKDGGEYTPSAELISGSEALQNVPAVAKKQVVVSPADFYLSEDILLYTQFINKLAEAFESAR